MYIINPQNRIRQGVLLRINHIFHVALTNEHTITLFASIALQKSVVVLSRVHLRGI